MPNYFETLQNWQQEMESSLRDPYSWLALAGLYWLEPGINKLGSADDCPVRLPERFPAHIADILMEADVITLASLEGADLQLNEQGHLSAPHQLAADTTGQPDFIFVDDLRFALIIRDGSPAIRLWDPQHPNRTSFQGRRWFPVDEAWRVPAQINRYEKPKSVMIDDILGFQQEGAMDVRLEFEIEGQSHGLDAQELETGAYYVILKDATAGLETYPAGRYMVTEVADGDKVFIDFNRAYNPPCAFTDHATCPLPRPENILLFQIEAGELYQPKN